MELLLPLYLILSLAVGPIGAVRSQTPVTVCDEPVGDCDVTITVASRPSGQTARVVITVQCGFQVGSGTTSVPKNSNDPAFGPCNIGTNLKLSAQPKSPNTWATVDDCADFDFTTVPC
jgi:hypothetical protein